MRCHTWFSRPITDEEFEKIHQMKNLFQGEIING